MASLHNNTHRFFPSFFRHFLIAQTIVNIIVSIFAQKSKATDRYSSSYGPAKQDVATTNFEPLIRRAVSLSISALWSLNIHQNVANDVFDHSLNRGVHTVPASQKNNVQKPGVLARRLVSWFFFSNTSIVVRPPSPMHNTKNHNYFIMEVMLEQNSKMKPFLFVFECQNLLDVRQTPTRL